MVIPSLQSFANRNSTYQGLNNTQQKPAKSNGFGFLDALCRSSLRCVQKRRASALLFYTSLFFIECYSLRADRLISAFYSARLISLILTANRVIEIVI